MDMILYVCIIILSQKCHGLEDEPKQTEAVARLLQQLYNRQGPRFSIRMVIGIFCSDTETGVVTPKGVMQKK